MPPVEHRCTLSEAWMKTRTRKKKPVLHRLMLKRQLCSCAMRNVSTTFGRRERERERAITYSWQSTASYFLHPAVGATNAYE